MSDLPTGCDDVPCKYCGTLTVDMAGGYTICDRCEYRFKLYRSAIIGVLSDPTGATAEPKSVAGEALAIADAALDAIEHKGDKKCESSSKTTT